MNRFYISTDAFSVTIDAADVNEAVEDAFAGEMRRPPVDLATLEARFAEIGDGAECLVRNEATGEEWHFGPY